MKSKIAGFSLLLLIVVALLVRPEGMSAQPKRSDLEERVARLEVDAVISRQNIQNLEIKIQNLKSNGDDDEGGRSRNLESSVRWIQDVYIPTAQGDFDKMDKRLKDLEHDHLLELVCAKPTTKPRPGSDQAVLAKQNADLCRAFGGKPN